MNKILNYRLFWVLLCCGIFVAPGCKKFLPTDRDFFDPDAQYSQNVYMPVTGRNTIFRDNFNAGNSSLPLTFELINPRRRNGDPAPELLKTFPTLVWKKGYTGKEKSLEEITEKRTWEPHPLFEIRKHSGEIMMWAPSSANLLHCQPDSGYLFDVKVSNSGGSRIFKGLKLLPYRERPYEPTNRDPLTGADQNPAVHPSQVKNVEVTHDEGSMTASDIDILFHKKGEAPSGKEGPSYTGTLTFKFLDSALHPIAPAKFNLTDWKALVHGFDMKKTDKYVKYTVAYPIPLVEMPTKYTTSSGQQAALEFSYDRLGFGGQRIVSKIDFDFNIYEPGNWEIVFWFRKGNPKFEDD